MELKRLQEELSSESFKSLYQKLRKKHGMLSPFSTVFDLIEFFHSDSRDYAAKDLILGFLVSKYQSGGPYHRLGAFFLVLFTPGIVRVYSIARRKVLALDPDEVLSQICLYLLETIKSLDLFRDREKVYPVKSLKGSSEAAFHRVASRIIGQVKNQMRGWVNQRLKEAAMREDLLEEERYDPLPIIEEGNEPVDLEEAARFLDIFVKAGVITDTDKLIILGSRVTKRSLKEISGDVGAYQRIKKRRQRAISAMKLYLQGKKRLRALAEGLGEDEISLAEIVRDLLE